MGEFFLTMKNVSCKNDNFVYCITCQTCKLQYVGQTSGTLMDRFKAHFRVINQRDISEGLGRHFNSVNHHGTDNMKIHILDFIFAPPEAGFALDMRLQVEFNWVQMLRTMTPMGLNTTDKCPTPQFCRNVRNCIPCNKIKKSCQPATCRMFRQN